MRIVVIQLLGGLGNQMFQAAAGLALAERIGGQLFIDTGLLRDHTPGRHSVNRRFDLVLFAREYAEVPIMWRLRHNGHGLGFSGKASSRLLRVLAPLEEVAERRFTWQELELKRASARPLYLQGLWQSWRYFAGQEASIREAFKFNQELPEAALPLAVQIRSDKAVALHVRRGDYVTNPKDAAILGFIGLEYYQRAIAKVCSSIDGNPQFFVFSDDLEWCRANFYWLPGQVSYVKQKSAGGRPVHHLDFQLLSQANRFVLSNSTFAWWAAWLAQSQDKHIVAPKAWFRDTSIDSSDLCPPEWVLV